MPVLNAKLKSRVKSHLGYGAPRGVPVGLVQRFNEACANIDSNDEIYGSNGINYWLDRCDRALVASDPTDSKCYTQRQVMLGDINRSTVSISSRDIDFWMELYYKQTDNLAFKLNVPNMRRPAQAQQTFVRWGSDYVQGVPGAADTCTQDRLWFSFNWA